MKIKIYLGEWFYNLGLVGFHRIIKHNNIDEFEYDYKLGEDYIEFDSNLLNNFHEYYFKYFLDRYDSAKDQWLKIQRYLSLIKRKPEKIKDYLKFIKEIVKKNNEKIKKIDESIFYKADEIYKILAKTKKEDDIEELEIELLKYKEILFDRKINERITLNKYKSILSNSFFGQVSYLNVVNTAKTIEEQKRIMFNDYISPILDRKGIEKSVKNIYDREEFSEFIEELGKKEKLNKNIEKLCKDINKNFIKKKRDLNKLENYIDENYYTCSMCCNEKSLGHNFSEGDFLPLGVSNGNTRNMFWNMNITYPICDICRLILICTPAGTVDIFKGYMDGSFGYEDKIYYGFVNMDIDVDELIKINENFKIREDKESPFKELLLDMVDTEKKIGVWQLQNILYVEFNSDYTSKNCKMNYCHIPKYLAKFLQDKAMLIKGIKDEKLKAEILDNIIKNIDLKFITDKKLRQILRNEYSSSFNCLRLTEINYYIRKYKGGITMKDKEDKRLSFLYMHGTKIVKDFKNNNEENKLSGIIYRLLNASKSNNKKDFMDTILRLHVSRELEVPHLFLQVLNENELSFDEVAHAFISGLTWNGKLESEIKGENKNE